jgi:acetyltransferase-like isoleucine patch superfamily enzyme
VKTLAYRAIERLIQRVRDDKAYRLAPELTLVDLIGELAYRGLALMRAQWFLLGVGGGHVRFVEAGCSIRHRRHLEVGSGSVIEYGTRLKCLSREGIVIGCGVTIGKYSLIECTSVLWQVGRGLFIGDHSSVGDFCFIGCAGGVHIGENVLMGQYVSFHSQNHRFEDPGQAIRLQGVTEEGIVVQDDCWLGSGCKILDGVTLGAGTVVAAGAVVTKSFPEMSIVAGVPARRIGDRHAAVSPHS